MPQLRQHDDDISVLRIARLQTELYITQTSPCNILQYFKGCKNSNFQIKKYDFFLFCSKTQIVGTRENCPALWGGFNEYPRSMFQSKIRKKVYTCKPSFTMLKVACKGVSIIRTCYHDVTVLTRDGDNIDFHQNLQDRISGRIRDNRCILKDHQH